MCTSKQKRKKEENSQPNDYHNIMNLLFFSSSSSSVLLLLLLCLYYINNIYKYMYVRLIFVCVVLHCRLLSSHSFHASKHITCPIIIINSHLLWTIPIRTIAYDLILCVCTLSFDIFSSGIIFGWIFKTILFFETDLLGKFSSTNTKHEKRNKCCGQIWIIINWIHCNGNSTRFHFPLQRLNDKHLDTFDFLLNRFWKKKSLIWYRFLFCNL